MLNFFGSEWDMLKKTSVPVVDVSVLRFISFSCCSTFFTSIGA